MRSLNYWNTVWKFPLKMGKRGGRDSRVSLGWLVGGRVVDTLCVLRSCAAPRPVLGTQGAKYTNDISGETVVFEYRCDGSEAAA